MGEENKNGLATETGGAEQIGQIFGKEMSKGQDSDSEYTGTIVVNNNIKDVKVDGTEVITVAVVGTTVIVGGIIYSCSDSEAAKTLGAAIEAKMKEEAGKAKKKIDLAVTIGAVIGVGVGKVFKSQVGIGETIPTPDTDPGAFKRGKNDGSTGYEGEDGSWWEKDRGGDRSHGGSSWKRWPNKKNKNKGKGRQTVGEDGKVIRE